MSPVQVDVGAPTRLDPLACRDCCGRGMVPVRAEGCTHPSPCPCEGAAVPCPWCMGGRVACGVCGERPADVSVSDDEVCSRCAAAYYVEGVA